MEQDRGPSNSLIVCIVYSLLFSNHSQSCSQVALAFYSLLVRLHVLLLCIVGSMGCRHSAVHYGISPKLLGVCLP